MKHNIHMITIGIIVLIGFNFSLSAQKADIVVFSYNRPIQLYALLESIETFVTGLQEQHIIYRATNKQYELAYQEVQKQFPFVQFHKQGNKPHKDFKKLTLKAAFNSPCAYIIFSVDDIIVKDFIDIQKNIKLLEQTNAYGFYFRLGLHLDWCYSLYETQKIPPAKLVSDDIYMWYFASGQYDWNYPHTVDMTLYKKNDIKKDLTKMNYNAPNSLEATWNKYRNNVKLFGLCHEETKIVNLPLNRVQQEFYNRNMNAFSTQELLEIFQSGKKIDIIPLFKIKNKSAHMDYIPEFTQR